jgi:hypothetical protein
MSIENYRLEFRKIAKEYARHTAEKLKGFAIGEQKQMQQKLTWTIIFSIITLLLIVGGLVFLRHTEETDMIILAILEGAAGVGIVITIFLFHNYRTIKNRVVILKEVIASKEHEVVVDKLHQFSFAKIQKLPSWDITTILKRGTLPFVKSGIYAIYCFKNNPDAYFSPIYVGKSVDIWKRWKQHANTLIKVATGEKGQETKYEKMITYLNHHQLTVDDLSFCVLRENYSDNAVIFKKLETHWMEMTGARTRGWNSVR